MIKTAIVISDESEADEVGMNDLITVYFEEDDLEEKYKIVTTVRSNSLANLISIESPLGKALLGHKVNDRVLVKVNDTISYYVTIRQIEKNDDDKDDRILSY